MANPNELVYEWKQREQLVQQERIARLGEGFLYLASIKEVKNSIAVPDLILGANLAYGQRLDAGTVNAFAIEAFNANFYTVDDAEGHRPDFRSYINVGIIKAVNSGAVIEDGWALTSTNYDLHKQNVTV